MKEHTKNLGIQPNLYPLFACMLTGRPWESVVAGIDKIKQTKAEQEVIQSTTTLVLPHISDILEQVDRQMLLVLKTNDIIRGIEATLQTQNRMTSFWVMSKCCVKSVCHEDNNMATTKWKKIKISLFENWTIFKLNFYYLYMGLLNLSLFSSIRQIL